MNKEELNKIICKLDNKNQALIMKQSITKESYDQKRAYIHKLWDIVNNQAFYTELKKYIDLMLFNGVIDDSIYKELKNHV